MTHSTTSLISTTLILYLTSAGLDGSDVLLCNRAAFDFRVYNHCIPIYMQNMAAINYQDECPWPNAEGYYTRLDKCVQLVSKRTACHEPSLKNEIFLELHRTHFSHCSYLQDPDVPVLLLLTLPCIIVTLLFPCLCMYLTTKG